MGLFGRKKKNKNKVSFGADIGGGNAETDVDTIEPEAPQDNSEKPTSLNDMFLPFRQPKTPDRILSLNSDIRGSNHQNATPIDENDMEAEYMDDSVDEMDEMTADPLGDGVDEYLTPQLSSLVNKREADMIVNNNKTATINASSLGTTVMPSILDLDKSQSARNKSRGINPHGINRLTLIGENNHSNSNSKSNSNSTAKAQSTGIPLNKNIHDTNHSNQASPTTASSDSAEPSTELRHAQQRQRHRYQEHQHYPLQNQLQYYPQEQQQLTPQEIQSEQTRELVKIFIGEIWNRGEIESIQKVCSPRLRFNGHTGLERVGHDGFSRMVATVRSSLDGYHCEIHSMVVEGRKCFCRLKFTGKHVGELMGCPPTNKLVSWMGASEFTICPRKKLILKVWELGDIKTLEAQLMGWYGSVRGWNGELFDRITVTTSNINI